MANRYSSPLARKQPTLGLTRYPTGAEVAAVLRGKRQVDGSYMCSCPGPLHRRGDSNPSLSVKDGRNRLLLYCFAGCAYDEIATAVRARGLRP
jgi:hypothetical protein